MFGKYRVPKGFSRFPAEIWEEVAPNSVILGREKGASLDGPRMFTDAGEFSEYVRIAESTKTSLVIKHYDELLSSEIEDFWNAVGARQFYQIRLNDGGPIYSLRPPLKGVRARTMELRLDGGTLKDCKIGCLVLRGQGEVTFENCQIGRLEIKPLEVPFGLKISIVGCEVLVLSIPHDGNLVDINIQNSRISDRYEASKLKSTDLIGSFDRMTFATLHKLGVENGNTKLVHQARGWELSVERAQADRTEKPFYWLWWLFSNYGLSLWRPLVWLLAFVIACAVLLFVTGTSVGIDAAALTGWRRNLVEVRGAEQGAEIVRAIVGATESVFSPFSLFSARRMVVPDLGWVATIQFFISYICVALLFLFGFSVRRRFKIS